MLGGNFTCAFAADATSAVAANAMEARFTIAVIIPFLPWVLCLLLAFLFAGIVIEGTRRG